MTTINRNGNRWTINEILSLQREYELLEWTVQQIAEKHQRTVRAILFKLNSEGFIESWNDARGFDIEEYEASFNETDAEDLNFHEPLEDDDEDYVEDEEDEDEDDDDDEDLDDDEDEDLDDDEDEDLEDDEDLEEDLEDDEDYVHEDDEDYVDLKEEEKDEYDVVQEIGLIVKKIFDSVIKKHTKQLTL